MEQITIDQIDFYTETKEGKTLTYKGKDGKNHAYKKIRIKSGEDILWGAVFDSEDNVNNWKEGDTVSLIITENNGYLNFKIPSKLDELEERIIKLENIISLNKKQSPDQPTEYKDKFDEFIEEEGIIPF